MLRKLSFPIFRNYDNSTGNSTELRLQKSEQKWNSHLEIHSTFNIVNMYSFVKTLSFCISGFF